MIIVQRQKPKNKHCAKQGLQPQHCQRSTTYLHTEVPCCLFGCGSESADTLAHYMCRARVRDLCSRATFCDARHASRREWLGLEPGVEAEARAQPGGRLRPLTTECERRGPRAVVSAIREALAIAASSVFREISHAIHAAHGASASPRRPGSWGRANRRRLIGHCLPSALGNVSAGVGLLCS